MAIDDRLKGGGERGGRTQPLRPPRQTRNGTPDDQLPALGWQASASGTSGGVAEGADRNGWVGQRMLGRATRIVTTSASNFYSWIFKRPADGGVLLLSEAEKPTVDYIEAQTDILSPSAAEAEAVARAYMGEEVTTAVTPARVFLTTVGSKKRGSAVLEDGGYSSGGPIRRLRPRSSSMMNDKACQTMKSWDFPGPQDLDEAGSGCNPENDLNHGFSWKGTEQSQTTIPTASIASSAFGDDKFVPMTSLPCPAFDAPSRAPLEPARERVVFACTILDLLYSVLQWPTRAELIAQYPHQVDYDRSRERAVQQLLMAADVVRLRKAEGELVEELSNLDQLKLYEDVGALIWFSKSSRADRQQVRFLLERLSSSRVHPSAHAQEIYQFSPEISMSSLKKRHVLGTGAFGIVHKANWLGTGVARKTFLAPSSPDFEQKVKILEGLSHPNIVSLLWYTRDERKHYMIMELMDGDLYSLMQERLEEYLTGDPPFSISEAVHIMLQVAKGCFSCMRGKLCRDLKSHNILVNN